MGFTQRQAAGKFTRDEAAAFIRQLEDAQFVDGTESPPAPAPARLSSAERAVRAITTEHLAAELQRRGWIVIEP